MGKTIMIEGKSNVGKTTILNYVFDILCSNGATYIEDKKPLGSEPQDFSCIIDYNGKKVAFFTMGDSSREISKAIDKYKDCDYLICAFNTGFAISTIEKIKSKCSDLTVIPMEKYADISSDIFKALM